MAYINTDKHGTHLLHLLWELHRKEVATCFAVYLLQDIGGFAQIERVPIAASDYLRWALVLTEDLFVHLVDLLAA